VKNPLDLTFPDAALEAAYRLDFAQRWRGYHRAGAALLPVLFLSFAIVDGIVASGPALRATLAVRVVTSVALAGFLPVYFWERLRPVYERHLATVLLAQAVVALGGLELIGALLVRSGGREWLEASLVGLLVAWSFLYGSARLRVPHAVGVSTAAMIGAFLILASSPDVTAGFALTGAFYAAVGQGLGALVAVTLERDAREAFLRTRELTAARAGTERLLHNVLHPDISERMRHTAGRTFAEAHPAVTVVLADLSGFTPLCQRLGLDELGDLLDQVFGRFDEVCERHGALKIKTLGDGWLAVSGLPHARADHARAGAALARDMVAAVREVREVTGQRIGLRIGLASGPVVAGVIGRTRYAYDVWGATVREATAMEQGGAEDRIRLAPSTARALEPAEVVDEGGVFWLR
jgi:class 3 adenylate cyclase